MRRHSLRRRSSRLHSYILILGLRLNMHHLRLWGKLVLAYQRKRLRMTDTHRDQQPELSW